MSRQLLNVNEETFENVTVFGHTMIFTCSRCDRNTLPKGLFFYEVRHDDEGRGDPCEIAEHILVNHLGTLISDRSVRLERPVSDWKPFRLIDPETDWSYEGTQTSLKEYMQKHPPLKEKSYER